MLCLLNYSYSIQNSCLSFLVLRIYSSLGCLTPTITTIFKIWKSVQRELKEFYHQLVSRYVINLKNLGMIIKKLKTIFSFSLNLWRMLVERQALQLSTLAFWIAFWRFQIQLVKRKNNCHWGQKDENNCSPKTFSSN